MIVFFFINLWFGYFWLEVFFFIKTGIIIIEYLAGRSSAVRWDQDLDGAERGRRQPVSPAAPS